MQIFQKIKKIIQANINDLLDRSEDPEKMVNQMILDMEDTISELRKTVANAITTRKLLEKKIEKNKNNEKKWQQNAELAIKDSNDELAKQALQKKNEFFQRNSDLNPQLVEAQESAEILKTELAELEEKVQEARRKREMLMTKKRAAEIKDQMYRNQELQRQKMTSHQRTAGNIIDGFDEFERLEEKIEKKVAEVEAKKEVLEVQVDKNLEKEFENLKIKQKKGIEEELETLKKKMEEKDGRKG